MLLLGGIALFSIRKSSWLILFVVECGNFVLLFVIVVRTLLAQASGCRLTPYVHFRTAGWYSCRFCARLRQRGRPKCVPVQLLRTCSYPRATALHPPLKICACVLQFKLQRIKCSHSLCQRLLRGSLSTADNRKVLCAMTIS